MGSGRRTWNPGEMIAVIFIIVFVAAGMAAALSLDLPFIIVVVVLAFGLLFLGMSVWAIRYAFSSDDAGQASDPVVDRRGGSPFITDPGSMYEGPCEYTGYCPRCGSPVERTDSVCSVCGRRLRWTAGSGPS